MKFAIPLAEGVLCAHFGHCQKFAIIEAEDGQIKDKELHTPPPHEPGVLPNWLAELGVSVVIAGGMGRRAPVGAPSSPPEALVEQYLKGTLIAGQNICDH
jgi:predicted Fe-Mo cluster-binding NifX family protein